MENFNELRVEQLSLLYIFVFVSAWAHLTILRKKLHLVTLCSRKVNFSGPRRHSDQGTDMKESGEECAHLWAHKCYSQAHFYYSSRWPINISIKIIINEKSGFFPH